MDETTLTAPTVDDSPTAAGTTETDIELIDEELLVEEISIDGMCGVY